MRSVARVTVLANMAVVLVGLAVVVLLPSGDAGNDRQRVVPATRPSPTPSEASAAGNPAAIAAAAKKVKANEAGMIPVIMYHRLLRRRIASIDRTPAQLRAELARLAREHYVPITAAEFVSGKFSVPAGTHPVVLTFDDGHPSHFALDAHGRPKKDTAVEIIEETAARFPGFRPVATFWVNGTPFGIRDPAKQKEAVKWLVGHGFEVANHTYSHPDLHTLKPRDVEKQIVREKRLLGRLGAPESTTFALPYGSSPKKSGLAHKGSWDGTSYRFDGVFLASAKPSVSPYAKAFPRYAIPRVQSNGKRTGCPRFCTEYWLNWLDEHPRERYTSDGDPAHVAVPRNLKSKIATSWAKAVIAY
ncbi:xylanase [Planotetraspora thailandica]|uniref:Xylanase n=1 Tax=Planotetraspora thailandica TaxID=487172 RepID=A0A8J3UY81_9ACTN|nr:polysaccharide deacetylase family protein [Planotetraspora thailandica]GII54043.1 xylanase [Planotetraspora thailandica]